MYVRKEALEKLGLSLLQNFWPMFFLKEGVRPDEYLVYLPVAVKQITLLHHKNCWFSPDLRNII